MQICLLPWNEQQQKTTELSIVTIIIKSSATLSSSDFEDVLN